VAGISGDPDRQVVPRLREYRASLARKELAPVERVEPEVPAADSINQLLDDWKHDHSVSVASDLVSSAFIVGLDAAAIDAAEFLLKHPSATRSARSIAAIYLKRPDESVLEEIVDVAATPCDDVNGIPPYASRRFQARIHSARSQLVEFPRNPILWTDLARLYTTVGSHAKATRAMESALSLAQNNRFVLRAASRLFLHQDESERAHELLVSSNRLLSDPWILAAEIATAAANKRTSKFVKKARLMLESGRYSAFHLSELASAVGTLEAEAGKTKAGRKLTEYSLLDPTENAVAQADWLVRKTRMNIFVNSRNSNEATAWKASRSQQWVVALNEARLWLDDQPFSSRPASFGSHLAGVLDKHDVAVGFARLGLLSNGDDFNLMNNLAFSLLNQYQLPEAQAIIERLKYLRLTESDTVVLSATTGLMYFRSEQPGMGRCYYREAISLAQRANMQHIAAVALTYLALEETRIGSTFADSLRREALAIAPKNTAPWMGVLVDRLEGLGSN
jgi:tetratricopeptide (TPR) repeat protein